MKLLVPLITLLIMSCANDSIGQETPSKPVWHRMDGLPLSLEIYPIFSDMIVSEDGEKFPLAYRKPIGTGPFPVMLFFHGGVRSFSRSVVDDFLKNATTTRFLKKGYMVVASTRRELQWRKTENPSSYTAGMVYDGIAAVRKAKTLPGADPESIVIYGGSVGGSLAIETAAQTSIAAVVSGEPASDIWMGPELKGKEIRNFGNYDVFPSYYTEEVKSFVRSLLDRIDCPFLLLHGDPTGFRTTDYLYVMRELTELGKRAKSIGYGGYQHGFYWGMGTRQMTGQELDEVIEDTHTFILPHLKTKPKPL